MFIVFHLTWGHPQTSLGTGARGSLWWPLGLVQWDVMVGAGPVWEAPLVMLAFWRDPGPPWECQSSLGDHSNLYRSVFNLF